MSSDLGFSGPQVAQFLHRVNTEVARVQRDHAENPDGEIKDDVKVESLAEMDPQQREELIRFMVMGGSGVKSDGNQLIDHITALRQELPTDETINRLDGVLFLCELTHNANALKKIGGLEIILDLLSHPDERVRLKAADIIFISSSNNPKFQNQVYATKSGVGCLTSALESETDPAVRAKLWSGVSHLCRNHNPNLNVFLAYKGYDILGQSLEIEDDPKQLLRICRFVNYLLADWQDSNPTVMRILGLFNHVELCLERDLLMEHPEIIHVLMEGVVLFMERDLDRKKYVVTETGIVDVAKRIKAGLQERYGDDSEISDVKDALKVVQEVEVVSDRYRRYDRQPQMSYSTDIVLYKDKNEEDTAASEEATEV